MFIKKLILLCCLSICMFSCTQSTFTTKEYNVGINIIPTPLEIKCNEGEFKLTDQTSVVCQMSDGKYVADFLIDKLVHSTGLEIKYASQQNSNVISLLLNDSLNLGDEAYQLVVTSDKVEIVAKTETGLFYGVQTLLQLLPAEVESKTKVDHINWTIPTVQITDEPRFGYRSCMLDPCRHFIPKDAILKQIDILSMFKINTLHLHLTDDQGWRIEIKKYPKLTEIGSKRIEGEGTIHQGFYTQEDIKEIVDNAAKHYITVIPELELPGHELAAIAAYPELSCKNSKVKPRIVWGVEDVVMCPGKEEVFTFLENVIAEMVQLFPGPYFHIGGDECPKTSWASCPLCQARIKSQGFKTDSNHTAEQYLQSYVVRRVEKVLKQYNKKLIGWDEILQGGLSPDAIVMSWRGELGGIEAAKQDHEAIMASHGNGMYLDQYQGDSKIEPVSIGGYTSLERTYSYDPVPDTLKVLGKAHLIKGVQCNLWSEYIYTPEILEYRMYPRVLALAEIGWTQVNRKDYKDFERRINNAYVRLDMHNINYHIPQPEQLGGSCNRVVFTDSVKLAFQSSRPIKMVYTTDGSTPTAHSKVYKKPIELTANTNLKIRSILPSGVMSKTRTIRVENEKIHPATKVEHLRQGLSVQKVNGTHLDIAALEADTTPSETLVVHSLTDIRSLNKGKEYMVHVQPHSAIAAGYINIPETGVYFVSSNNEEVWIDDNLLINNSGEVKRFSRNDNSIALEKGLHKLKVVFLGHIIGGWPTWWDDSSIQLRLSSWPEFKYVTPNQLYY